MAAFSASSLARRISYQAEKDITRRKSVSYGMYLGAEKGELKTKRLLAVQYRDVATIRTILSWP
jgi:hypothetical protein